MTMGSNDTNTSVSQSPFLKAPGQISGDGVKSNSALSTRKADGFSDSSAQVSGKITGLTINPDIQFELDWER